MDFFELIVKVYGRHDVAITFVFCCIVWFYPRLLLKNGGGQAEISAGISVSLGIFFTFLGLALALVAASGDGVKAQFDVLLAGLSTAFWTSVVGLLNSIRIRCLLAKNNDQDFILSGVEKQIVKIRSEISCLGKDINEQLTQSLSNAVTQYSEQISDSISSSASGLARINSECEETVSLVERSLNAITNQFSEMAGNAKDIIEATSEYNKEAKNLIESNSALLSEQSIWMKNIDKSMSSVAELAPEAEKVFSAINVLEDRSKQLSEEIKDSFEFHKVKFTEDLKKLNDQIIKNMNTLDSDYQNLIARHLESLDGSINKSLGLVVNNFGEGIVALAQKKVSVVESVIEQLEFARNQYAEDRASILGAENNAVIVSEELKVKEEA